MFATLRKNLSALVAEIVGHSPPNSVENSIQFDIILLHSHKIWYIYNYTHIHAETKSTIMTNGHISLEKYTTHTLFEMVAKGLYARSELETEQTATYWPPVPLSLAVILSRSDGLHNRGILRTHSPLMGAGSLCSTLSPNNWLQLTEPVCGPGLYNCLTSTCFLWASHLHPIQRVHSQGYTLIYSTRCTCSLIDGCVGGQYVTILHY